MNPIIWFVGFIIGMLLFGVFKQTPLYTPNRNICGTPGETLFVGIVLSLLWPFTLGAGFVSLLLWACWKGLLFLVHLGTTARIPEPISSWLGIRK